MKGDSPQEIAASVTAVAPPDTGSLSPWERAGVRGRLIKLREKPQNRRSGLTLVEVVVVSVVVVLVVLLVLMALPRGRENARLASCQLNMSQIGKALALYEQSDAALPAVGALTDPEAPRGSQPPSPLRTLLETLQIPDLREIKDGKTRPEPRPGEVPGEMPVPGFISSSDPNAAAGRFPAPVSYRGTTGDDPSGTNGSFAPGSALRLAQVDAGDGRSYTAAFSERLVGDNQEEHIAAFNYRLVSPTLGSLACPPGSDPSGWRGDAGSSWFSANYRSTLYNHALPPGGQPSCVSEDGKAAYLGASSGHVRGVNLLLLDGSVSITRPSIDLKVWKELARIGPPESTE